MNLCPNHRKPAEMADDQTIAELRAMTAERDRLRAALHELVEAGDIISTGTSTDRAHYERYHRAEAAARAALAATPPPAR